MGTRVLLCLLAALVALPAAAASPTDAEYHFLRVDGRALFLERAALNGRTMLSGTLIRLSLPLWVDKYL